MSRAEASVGTPPPVPRRRSAWFYCFGILGAGIVLIALLVAGLLLFASTQRFANLVRQKVVAALGDATGGRVEIESFHWNLLHLAVEVDNLTIHGLEGPNEVPYAHLDRLYARARIVSLFRPAIALDYLQVDHPVFHLIVYPDGHTNQPVPHHKTDSSTSAIDTVFNLQVRRAVVNHGLALVNQRAIPFQLAANDLGTVVTYNPDGDRYLGEIEVADLDLQRGGMRPLHSRLTLQLELARNEAQLKAFRFISGPSQLEGSGSITGFAAPQWQFATRGNLELREVAALAGIDGLDHGTARLDLSGQGKGSAQFLLSGNAQLVNAAFETDYLRVVGVNASTTVKVTPDEIVLKGVRARLSDGSSIDAVLRFLHWRESGSPTPREPSSRPATNVVPVASIRAQVRGVRLPTVLQMVAIPRFQNLGFDTNVDGSVNVDWTGSGSDLSVAAKVLLSPPGRPVPGGIPLSGLVDAKYLEKGGKVQINRLEVQSGASELKVSGMLGVYPITGASALQVDLTTHSLGEFDRVLTDLGLAEGGKTGVAVIPVRLRGDGAFSGTVAGSLIDPDVKGHLTASDFTTTFSLGHNLGTPASELAKAHPGPEDHGGLEAHAGAVGSVRSIHWDRLDAMAEYSSRLISIRHAKLMGNGAEIDLHGELHDHRISARRSSFDEFSAFDLTARIHHGDLNDLFAIAGQSAPITGTVELQVHAGGSLEQLNGGGHLDLVGGELLGEPYHKLTAEVNFTGHSIQLEKATLLADSGTAIANGSYDLKEKSFLANLDGKHFELAQIRRLQNTNVPIAGSLNFDAHASGTLETPSVLVGVHLTHLVLRGQPAGNFDAVAHTVAHTVLYTAHSTLNAPLVELSGQTELFGDFQTEAKLSFSGLDIAPVLKAWNVQNLSGSSVIRGTVTLAGPAKRPLLFRGDAEIDQFSATLENITVQSEGPLRANYQQGIVRITQAHITGPDTNMQVSGTAALLGNKALNLAASGSINMALAESLDSDITASGHVDFNVEAGGTMTRPQLTGQVRLKNVAMSLNDIPTGISKLNGTLVFDQDRLEVQNLIGTTGGGQLKVGGFITYEHGVYGDLTATGQNVRVRYSGLSATADTTLHLQGSQANMLLGGNIMITRFVAGPNLDFAVFAGSVGASAPPNPTAASNHVRLDIHILSSPQLDFQNSYAQLAGSVDLRLRGTVAQPSLLGRINIIEGTANFAGTTYQLQHGDIYFSNPVRIDPVIDIDASTRIEEYDVTVGMHGSVSHLTPTFRSEPPLPQADVISLLALGRTQQEQQLYSQEEDQVGVNSTTNALLGGALSATVGSRVQKLFGVGSVKIDPTYIGNLGNSTARITVQQNISRNVQLTYATNVNTTAEQLIQAQVNLTDNVSVLAVRDESNVFSVVLKIHKRFR